MASLGSIKIFVDFFGCSQKQPSGESNKSTGTVELYIVPEYDAVMFI